MDTGLIRDSLGYIPFCLCSALIPALDSIQPSVALGSMTVQVLDARTKS